MNTSISTAICASGLIMLLGASTHAMAGEPQSATTLGPSVTVHFGDLNPSTSQGVEVLYGRIKSAAQTVCGPWDRYWEWKVCYQATIDHAVGRINLPRLTALHRASTPGQGASGQLQAAASAPGASKP
jgi:UrcA family protein